MQTPHLAVEIIHLSGGATRPLTNVFWTPQAAAFTPNGRYVLSAYHQGWRLVRTRDDTVRTFLKAPCAYPQQFSFSPDGRRITFVCDASGALPWIGVLTIASHTVVRLGDWHDSSPVWISSSSVAALHASTQGARQQVRTYDLSGHVLASVTLAVQTVWLFATH